MSASVVAALRRFLEVEHVELVGRAALGIHAALLAWPDDGAVAMPASVCQDVLAAVLCAGRIPLFCDTDPDTGLVQDGQWQQCRAQGATIAIQVHLYGNPAPMSEVCQVFADGLVIEDAAQALGARTASRLAGTGGDVGVFSFGPTKQIDVGGAALVFRDPLLQQACIQVLEQLLQAQPEIHVLHEVQQQFRGDFDRARTQNLQDGSTHLFQGVLQNYRPLLIRPWASEWEESLLRALKAYPDALQLRREKAACWQAVTQHAGLQAIGMTQDSAPWRYACRLPGINAQRQQQIGCHLRARGLEVSHWYLPVNWFMPQPLTVQCTGAEQLAREVFQFWLDASVSPKQILKTKSWFEALGHEQEASV